MKSIKRLNDIAVKCQSNVLILMFLILLALMLIQVIYRYFLELPLPWSEEIARYVFVIVTYLGASIAVSENSHIEINVRDLLLGKIVKDQKPREYWNLILSVLAEAVTLTISAIIAYEFILMVIDDYTFDQVSISLGFPMYFVTGFVLLCLVMLTMHCLIRMVFRIGELVNFRTTQFEG
ncbi:MAG: TRAP transporter small permease [Deltaproteobacteria bacterium]|nr:TRAP transporter small permease [Deltaproteobacteria bacterium]